MQQTPAMNTEKSTLVERLREAGLSLRCFLKVDEKKAAFETEWQRRLYTPEELENYPRWGINGRDGLVLVDVDKEEMIDVFRTKLPATFEIISPRRKLPHFYYKVVGGEVENKVLHLLGDNEGAGEVRAQNHYLVAPGTTITYKDAEQTKTGKYKVLHDRPIAVVSYNRFMNVITPYLGSDTKQKITYKQMREGVPQGTRHQQAMKYASFLVKVQKFDAATALTELTRWNQLCKPPMPINDLERMVKNALGYPGRPVEDVKREVSLTDIAGILSTTIKKDRPVKLITFLIMLLTYTDEDQQTVCFKGESSGGKSYNALEIAEYFPEEDVTKIAYSSPTAFFHDYGDWDKDRHAKIIDLRQKILIFLDQPHDMLLQRLRPLLSHDSRELLYKITDRQEKHGTRTKYAILEGYPTVIFCTAKMNINEQEKTRMFLLSPETTHKKIEESLHLLAKKLGNRSKFQQELNTDEKRLWLKTRIQAIKDAKIKNVVIENANEICERFIVYRENLIPRHQRDFPRLTALIKAHALLNCFTRDPSNGAIIAQEEDIHAGFQLYEKIVKPNELGLSPEVYEIFTQVIEPNMKVEGSDDTKHITRKEILTEYHKKYHRALSVKRLEKQLIPALISAGKVYEAPHPTDKRCKALFLAYEEPAEEEQEEPTEESGDQKINAPGYVGKHKKLDEYTPRAINEQRIIPTGTGAFISGDEQSTEDMIDRAFSESSEGSESERSEDSEDTLKKVREFTKGKRKKGRKKGAE